ncbi:hypothetical protein TraAM80_02263 [Trypanosoma rangeli]|uniref:Uncharacterized protein n=1 Tax=Trypanosoma rangeli TaxID=5698 RepID=A0A422NV28_TRYRA|nr:uncharacterized protein TraAM80_02263 [Trypanosoma rangeli]RNF09316.1 hypothetical protein TraAM80_02263 [Trypanosoma rangeli]|eukprot:RNF09316.1 hypothetical protein TraAM80_02263 [Trypanosoma rangeli]
MLPQLQAHPAGATRVCVGASHVLTGGVDGVVALYPQKRWPSCHHLWARQCHDGAVTYVVLHAALELALSCGRDGKVILHENVLSTSTSTSRVICRVTGEVRCVLFDAERQRVFVAGDSLRCLQMSPSGCSVQTLAMNVPHPLVSLALSPCGNLIAVASASGAVGVVSAWSSSNSQASSLSQTETAPEQQAAVERLRNVSLMLQNVLSPTAKRDDTVAYRLCWGRDGEGSLLLLVPGVAEFRVLRLEEATTPPYKHRLRHVAGIDSFGMTDLLGATCYALSTNILCVVLAGTTGIVVAKMDVRKWGVTRLQGQSCTEVTDAHADAASGDVVVGTRDGTVTYLRRVAPKALAAKRIADTGALPTANGVDGSVKKRQREVLLDGSSSVRGADTGKKRHFDKTQKKPAKDNDDDIIGDSSSGDEEVGDSDDDSGSHSASSSALIAKEDFRQVVDDLKRTNPHYKDDSSEEERPSRWRKQNPKEALIAAEEECRKHRSVFLDDEAEESSDNASDGDDTMERGEGYRRGGRGVDDGGSLVATDTNSSLASSHSLNDVSMQAATAAGGGGATTVFDYSFQIGATPVGEEGSCYLAYNSVGYIHSTAEGTTIHFHDMSIQAVRILERGTILLAALSPVGAAFVLAQDADMDSVDDTPRLTLYYRTFVAIGAQSDWRVRLYPGETVRCLTVGIRYTAVATSRYLRLFSLSGLEIAVLSLFPRIVTMVGTNSSKIMHSFKADFDPLAVCYLEGGGEMRLQVLDVGSRSVVLPSVVVPLTTQPDGRPHQLQWMGWSEDGPLHVADTAGVLRMFTLNWGGSWLPVLDPQCMTDQTYNLWIWGVSDEAVFAYRSCKSDPPYPVAIASGLPTEHVRLFLPLTRFGTEKDMVTWDHLLRREVRTDEVKRRSSFYTAVIAKHDALHDRKIIELFKTTLQEQQTTRALDLATQLELRDNIEVCAKEANAQGHGQLVQKLLALLEVRMKAKKRRRCTLPLEGSVVSERERDMLLRKLLAKENPAAVAAAATATVGNAYTGEPQPVATTAVVEASGRVSQAAAVVTPAVTPERRPAAGDAPIATTTAAAGVSRRHVTFTDQVGPSPTKRPAEVTTTTPPRNVLERGMKSSSPQQQGPAISTPTRTKPQNPFSKPAKTTMIALTKAPSAQPPLGSRSTSCLVLGDSQSSIDLDSVEGLEKQQKQQSLLPVGSPPRQRANTKVTSPEPLPATTSSNGSGGKGGGPTNGGKKVSPPVMDAANEPRRTAVNLFCPKALPDGRPAALLAAADTTAGAVVDPFLDQSENSTPVTLEALLVDVGHETSQVGAPRSVSFGEALRKRYLEEEEDDDVDGGDGVTDLALPRMAH